MKRISLSSSSAKQRQADTSYYLDNSGNLSVIHTNTSPSPAGNCATDKWINICQQQQVFEARIQTDKEKNIDQQVRETFLALFADNQKEPLIAILDFARLTQGLESNTKNDKPHLTIGIETQLILDGIRHLHDIIKAKISFGSTQQQANPHSSRDLFLEINESIQALSNFSKTKNIVIDNQAGITKYIHIKDSEFKPIFKNVLFNALQWNRIGSRLNITYQIINPKNLRIKISSPESSYPDSITSTKILQPFNEVHHHTYRLEGSGIGLIIANKIIEFIGGGFSADFKNGGDNIFDIVLPIAESENKNSIEQSQHAPDNQHKILYIEDNASHIELVECILEKVPQTNLVSTLLGSEGLALATTLQPSLILLDIRLSDMNGYEVLKKLQSNSATQHIPVLALSASAMTHEVKYGLDLGFKHYLTKPFRIREFIQLIESELLEIPLTTENQLFTKD